MIINRAKDFTKQAKTGGNYYSAYDLGENDYNRIVAARQVQCGDKCGLK